MVLFAALVLFFTQGDPAALIEKLGAEGVEERDDAARKLRALGKGAVRELRRALKHEDAEIAARAREVLRDLFTPRLREALPDVEKRLDVDGDHAWTEAFLEIAGLRSLQRVDVEPLAMAAVSGAATTEEKVAVCNAVDERSLRSATREIVKLLKDPEGEVVMAALAALAGLGAWEAVSEIAALLDSSDIMIRRSAKVALAELRASGGLAPIRRELEVSEEGLRDLLRPPPPAAGEPRSAPLVRSLRETISSDRRSSAWMIVNLSLVDAIPALVELLKDDESVVRSCAAQVLGDLGAAEAAETLRGLAKDRDPDVRRAAEVALAALEDREPRSGAVAPGGAYGRALALAASSDPSPGLKDANPFVRETAAWAVGAVGAKDAIPKIVELLKDPDGDVRSGALDALAALGAKEAPVADLLKDEEARVRSAAARCLGRLGSPEAERLRDRAMPGDLTGTRREILETIAKAAEVRLELPDAPDWLGVPARIRRRTGVSKLLDALDRLVETGPYGLVLESGHVRIAPRQALRK